MANFLFIPSLSDEFEYVLNCKSESFSYFSEKFPSSSFDFYKNIFTKQDDPHVNMFQ